MWAYKVKVYSFCEHISSKFICNNLSLQLFGCSHKGTYRWETSVCSPSTGHNSHLKNLKKILWTTFLILLAGFFFQKSRSKVKVKVIKRSKISFWLVTSERMVLEGHGFLLNNLEVYTHLASHWLFSVWRHVFPQNDVKNWWKYIFLQSIL